MNTNYAGLKTLLFIGCISAAFSGCTDKTEKSDIDYDPILATPTVNAVTPATPETVVAPTVAAPPTPSNAELQKQINDMKVDQEIDAIQERVTAKYDSKAKANEAFEIRRDQSNYDRNSREYDRLGREAASKQREADDLKAKSDPWN